MPNREKIVKGLECIAEDRQKSCTGCEYSILGLYPFCVHGIARDALSLLKEHDAVEPDTNTEGTCTCGNCGETVGYYPVGCSVPQKLCKYCPECGRKVKWG